MDEHWSDFTPGRRPSGRRTWLLLGGAAIVLGGALWVAAGNLVNTQAVREAAARSVRASLGRNLTINGPIRIQPGLNPALVAEDISLANPDGMPGAPMLHAQRLRASLDLFSLLTGTASIRAVEMEGAELVLAPTPDGKPNWRFERPSRITPLVGEPAAEAPHAASESRHARLEIGRIVLRGGHVTWRSPSSADLVLEIGEAELRENGTEAPIFGRFTGRLGALPVTLNIQAGNFERLQGGPVTALAGAWPLTVKLTAGAATATLDGAVNHPDEWRGYIFRLTANAPDLSPLAPALPAPLGRLALHDVNLTVQLTDGSNGQFHTAGLSLFADDSDLGGLIPGLSVKRLQFSAPGPGQQAQLSIDGSFANTPLRVNGTATQPDALDAAGPVPLALSAQAASASISARGTIPPSLGAAGLDLAVNVRAPNLADLSPFALRPLPELRDISLDGKLADAGFKLKGVAVHELAFASALGDLSGDVTAAWLPVPTLNGSLKAKNFDLDAARAIWAQLHTTPVVPGGPGGALVLPAPAPQPAPPAPAPTPAPDATPRVIPDTPIDFSALHGADADLTLAFDQMRVNGQSWHDFNARLFASDGKLVLNPLRVRTPEGVLIGALSLDAGATPPPVALTLRSPSLAGSAVAGMLGLPGAITGNLQLDLELNAAGSTPRALAASLAGHAGISMVDGQVSDALWENALGTALNGAGIPLSGGTTQVHCLALRAEFQHGVGRFSALALDTNRLELEGEGSVDLGAETLGLHLTPRLAVGGTGVAAPVAVSGPFTAPKAALDPVSGGKFSLQIGGDGPSDARCIAALPVARGGQAGPLPAQQPVVGEKKKLKPKDLLKGLFH